jgi:hypothetical protein
MGNDYKRKVRVTCTYPGCGADTKAEAEHADEHGHYGVGETDDPGWKLPADVGATKPMPRDQVGGSCPAHVGKQPPKP